MINSSIYKLLSESATKNKLLIFIGAGASIGNELEKGLPSGGKLNQQLIDYYEENLNLENQPLDKVTEYIEKLYGRKVLIEKIYEIINNIENPLTTHNYIAELPIKLYVTTNYDILLEKSLITKRKNFNRVTCDRDITSISNNEINVFKIHGCISTTEDDIIITESDYYNKFLLKSNLFIDILKAWLSTHTCLFIGYSLSDVNLKYLFFEISKKLGVENIKGKFYALQHNPYKSDIEIWEKRGFTIVQEDKNIFLNNLIEYIEFKDVVRNENSIISKEGFKIGRLEIQEVKFYEQQCGNDGQRFILMSERKMKFLNVSDGQWLKIEILGIKNTIQFAKVFKDTSTEDFTIRLPLLTRNLLRIDTNTKFHENLKIRITNEPLNKLIKLELDSEHIEISQLPLELDKFSLENETPVIAIRNLEFQLLEFENIEECIIEIISDETIIFNSNVVLFESKFNPGRAVVGINSNFRRKIKNDKFKLIIKRKE